MQDLSASSVDPSGNIRTPRPELSNSLSVNDRGFLRCYDLYAGPIVGVEVPTREGTHIFAAFTQTSEAPNAKR